MVGGAGPSVLVPPSLCCPQVVPKRGAPPLLSARDMASPLYVCGSLALLLGGSLHLHHLATTQSQATSNGALHPSQRTDTSGDVSPRTSGPMAGDTSCVLYLPFSLPGKDPPGAGVLPTPPVDHLPDALLWTSLAHIRVLLVDVRITLPATGTVVATATCHCHCRRHLSLPHRHR